MEIRYYNENDFINVLQLVNRSMEFDQFTEALLKENVTDDPDINTNLTYVAAENGKIVGFIMGVIRKRDNGDAGYVKLFCVDPDFRRKGIGTELYRKVEDQIRSAKVKSMRVYESYPNYYMPGIDPFYTEAICFFERAGYKKVGDTSNLEADLLNQEFDTAEEERKALEKGVTIRRAEKTDFEKMIDWTDKNFKGWISEVSNSFNNDPISLHIAFLENKVIAFSGYESNNKGTGWFGPMGTSEAARGKGVGGILLKRCLADLKKMGFKKSIIPWVGPIPFYMHYVNSKVKRVFWRYEKLLE